MTDPYNSYLTYKPAVRATMQPAAPQPDRIANLNVSDTWKQRFRTIEKAGGANLHKFRELSRSERRSIQFNIPAFFLGPIYFVAKGLWRQALVYLLAAIAIVVAMTELGYGKSTEGLGIAFGFFYSMRANPSCYQLRVLGKAPWV